MQNQFIVGDKAFPTRKKMRLHFKRLLAKTEPFIPISDEAEKDVLALLEFHPQADVKKGEWIKAIEKRPSHTGTMCWWVIRPEWSGESDIDFSYLKCLDGVIKTTRSDTNVAHII